MADYVVTLTGKDNLSKTIQSVKKELDGVGGSAQKLDKVSAQFDKISKSTMPLNKRVKETSKLLSQMNFDGDFNAAQFLKMAQEAGKAKDAISDTQQVIKAFADDNFALNAVVQGVQGIAAAGSVATGAMALFGVESETAAEAIRKVQGALAILNGLQTVANVLNKDSYVSIARKVIALKAEAVATNQATAAQTRLNVAVLANPYVAAATAVAALATGLYLLYKNMDDTTDSQIALNAATEAYEQTIDSNLKTAAEQINTFNRLKRIYDESGGKVDVLKKKIIENDDAQRKLGVSLKTVDDVHRLFGKNSQNYINATIARTKAMAAEQSQALLLGNTMSELSKIFNKLMRGEEVNYVDLENVLKKSGLSQKTINKLISQAGGQSKFELFGKNDLYVPDYAVEGFASDLMSSMTDAFYKEGAGKVLGNIIAEGLSDAANYEIDYNKLLANNSKGTTKSGNSSGSSDKSTIDYEVGSLKDLQAQREKLNQELQKKNLTDEQIKQKQMEILELNSKIAEMENRVNAYVKQQLALRQKLAKVSDSASLGKNHASDIANQVEQNTVMPYVNAAKKIYSVLSPALEKFKNNMADQQAKDAEKVRNNWENAASALGSFGDAMSTLGQVAEDEGVQVAGIVAQAIAQIALGYASATAQAGKLGPWGWVAFAAAGLAQMMAMISQIKSVTGGYADGGIIGGSSYSGDKLLARVNSGEMVLNKRQQSNLFNAINSGNIGGGTVSTVQFKLRGADIYGSMKTYQAIKSKTGLKGI